MPNMIQSTTSNDKKYTAAVAEEFDGRDPDLDRVYYTLKIRDSETGAEVYRTNRHWVADQLDEYHSGVLILDIDFDDSDEILFINGGLVAPNCIPFVRIIELVDDMAQQFPAELSAVRDVAELPEYVAKMIRANFNGMGQPHDWLGHLERRRCRTPS